MAAGLAVALVVSRVRLVAVFGASWTDEDQALLWYAARDLLGGHLREPYFFGQPYGSWLEALLAAPAVGLGVPLRIAVAAAGSIAGTFPWFGFAAAAWWVRRSPLLTVTILGVALAMALEGSIISTLPRGLLPGVVLGCAAVLIVLVWARSPVAVAAFGALLLGSASLNVGAALVTGPVAVHLVLSSVSSWRRLAPALAGGLAVGASLHVLAQSFYRSHPAYDLHGTPAFSFSAGRLVENLAHLDRYLPAYAPEVVRGAGVAVVVVTILGGIGWVAITRRTVAAAAACLTAVLLGVAVLGTAKANDGTASLFFPYSRVYLGLPWMLCSLALLPREGRAPRSAVPRAGLAPALIALCLALAALASAADREVGLEDRVDGLLAAADGVPPVVPVATELLAERCDLRRRLASDHDVEVILDRYDRTATYGCGALLDGAVDTLFPEYERRTWILLDAQRRRIRRLLITGLDRCPPVLRGDCLVVDVGERIALVTGTERPVTTWASDLGLTVRTTSG